ncbi:WYL domain-containing protein [Capnocytophaga gingivalis]|uniref:helix-turn-helix transcriptional regulator n=1 Tax=Capnocytophaga gingivalis TaxID=1017 RepID=UPI0028D6C927|nr:WYL domain-containing protein [Capnocytophaga gingivalis]
MTTVAIFLRHQFIIQQLRSQGALTYNEIYDNYKDRFGDTFELRTLQRDIKDIECIYKIKIKYSKSDKVYRIVEEGDASVEDLLEAFDVFQAFQEHEDSYRYVVFDPRQLSGTQHLSFLIKAIIQQKRIEFRYQKRYPPKEVLTRTIDPYLLKESQRRWYLLGMDVQKEQWRIFALDCMEDLEEKGHGAHTREKAKQAQTFFDDSFSSWVGDGQLKAEKVVLSFRRNERDSFFTPNPAEYLRAIPLHRSQVFLENPPEEIILSLQIKITPDFIKEILSYGSHVKVISPEHLAERILQEIKNTLLLYAN